MPTLVDPRVDASNLANVHKCRYCAMLFEHSAGLPRQAAWNTRLLETDNFVVVPTLGALVEGWLLIVTKKHYLCMGSIPPELDDELNKLVAVTADILEKAYCAPTLFEHGPSREGSGMGCGIDHAHLHLVPLRFHLEQLTGSELSNMGYPWQRAKDDWTTLRRLHNSERAYVCLRDAGGELLFSTPRDLPCQFFRRVIAGAKGIPDRFDYHEYSFERNVLATLRRTEQRFADCAGVARR